MMSGMGGMMAAGVGMGVGSEVVRGMMGGGMGGGGGHGGAPQEGQYQPPMEGAQPQYQQENFSEQDPCAKFNLNMMSCFREQSSDISVCQGYMDMLISCQKDNQQF